MRSGVPERLLNSAADPPMRSLPQLPPVKVNGAGSDASTPSASPFSTLAHLNNGRSRRKGDTESLASPATTSERDGSRRSSSYWASKFQTQAKADFVRGDMTQLLERFEDTALYRHPQRKALQTVLDEMSAQAGAVSGTKDSKLSVLRRQTSDLMVIHRQYRQDSLTDATKALITKKCHERVKASALEPPPKVVPTRFLFDGTRCPRASRCDYCQFTGGELECATCNVVAHARCYLSAYEREDRKTRLTFVVPTAAQTKAPFSSWLCCHCQADLTSEYDERSAEARAAHLAAQRQVLANALTAYVRMMRDATTFATKKASIIRIQAMLRGRQARQRFERLQRMRLKPFALDALRVRAYFPSGVGNPAEALGLGISSNCASLEELRLGNGFSCNPFLYVTVVAGNDEDAQLFCFETSVRKPSATGGIAAETLDIAWPEKMFVPGADGNATFCFTLLSKNGPNTFFLGQAVLRLLETGDCWSTGLTTELELLDRVELFPKTAQHQPLPLADAGGNAPKFIEDLDEEDVNGKPRWVVNINLRPFGEQFSHCGYLNMKSTLESFHTSARWCVLADGVLRIYRHYGVTLASDVVDMARATEVRVVPMASMLHRTASSESRRINLTLRSDDNVGTKAHPELAERCCLAVNHLSRLYLFQCERSEQLREWLKKLQGAQKFSSQVSQSHSNMATAVPTPVC